MLKMRIQPQGVRSNGARIRTQVGIDVKSHVCNQSLRMLPSGSTVKNLPANAGDTGLIPGHKRAGHD